MEQEINYNVNISGKVTEIKNIEEMKRFLNGPENKETVSYAMELAETGPKAFVLCQTLHEYKKEIIQQFKKLPVNAVITIGIGQEFVTEECIIENLDGTFNAYIPYEEFHFKKVA